MTYRKALTRYRSKPGDYSMSSPGNKVAARSDARRPNTRGCHAEASGRAQHRGRTLPAADHASAANSPTSQYHRAPCPKIRPACTILAHGAAAFRHRQNRGPAPEPCAASAVSIAGAPTQAGSRRVRRYRCPSLAARNWRYVSRPAVAERHRRPAHLRRLRLSEGFVLCFIIGNSGKRGAGHFKRRAVCAQCAVQITSLQRAGASDIPRDYGGLLHTRFEVQTVQQDCAIQRVGFLPPKSSATANGRKRVC